MTASTIMIQGCTSDAGKSTLVAGLCRLLVRRGLRVAPIKPQNMALNSAVTADGGEIGRSQAVQAQACGLDAHSDMNPVLLKPNSDIGAQVIVHGRALTAMDAAGFHDYKRVALDAVLASHRRLAEQYEIIVAEGAGSPAEINLRAGDIANMGFAEAIMEVLRGDPALCVVGHAPNGQAAIEMTRRLEPDLITMDVQMPVMDGLQAIERIMAANPTPILVMTADPRGELPLEPLGCLAADLEEVPGFTGVRRQIVELVLPVGRLAGGPDQLPIAQQYRPEAARHTELHAPAHLLGILALAGLGVDRAGRERLAAQVRNQRATLALVGEVRRDG